MLRLREKYFKTLRRTRGGVAVLVAVVMVVVAEVVFFCDYNAYPSLDFDFDLD